MRYFNCFNCQRQVKARREDIIEFVACPVCRAVQLPPDYALEPGTDFHGHVIGEKLSSSMMWNTYEVNRTDDADDKTGRLCLPTEFFLRHAANFMGFVGSVVGLGANRIPDFPQIIEHSADQNAVFFVFDHQPAARSLADLIGDRGLDDINALILTRNCAAALRRLWDERHVTHQNINPGNLHVYPESGRIRLHELGVSQPLIGDNKLLGHGFNIWDMGYMAPEIILERGAGSPAEDIFSLGAIMYFSLTGRHPAPARPSDSLKFPDGINPAVAELCLTMMKYRPSERPGGWNEIIERMESIIGSAEWRSFKEVLSASAPRVSFGHAADGRLFHVKKGAKTEYEWMGDAPDDIPLCAVIEPESGESEPRSWRRLLTWVAGGALVAAILILTTLRLTPEPLPPQSFKLDSAVAVDDEAWSAAGISAAQKNMRSPALVETVRMDAAELVSVLRRAAHGTAVFIKRGHYVLSDGGHNQTPLHIKGHHLEIIGEHGVSIEGDISISGKHVRIANIKFRNGALEIADEAEKVTMYNCRFDNVAFKIDAPAKVDFGDGGKMAEPAAVDGD